MISRHLTNKSFSVKGTVGKSNVAVNGLLGNLLIAADDHYKPNAIDINYQKGCKLRYPRTLSTVIRKTKAVSLLRSKPKYSINDIASISNMSVGSVHIYLKTLYKMGVKKYNCMRCRLQRRTENSVGLNRLKRVFQAFIHGEIDLLQVFELTGWDPP